MNGNHIGEYRLVARLGRGRVTDVYLGGRPGPSGAIDLAVVKRLRAKFAGVGRDADDDAWLVEEARTAMHLSNANIVRTCEVSIDGSLPFWALEYVDGQPLDRVLAVATRSAGFTSDLVLDIVSCVLGALDYAHTLHDRVGVPFGIVHRDIRPHNIFLTYQGEVKLADFGVSSFTLRRNDDDTPDEIDDTRTYLAPEQALGMTVDRRADVYAVGMVLWECLANEGPRLAVDSRTALSQERHGLPPAASLRHGLYPALTAICDRALERDPDRRYPTAAAMRADLEKLRHDDADGGANEAIASLMQRLFSSDRHDHTRRIRHLLAMNAIESEGWSFEAPRRPAPALSEPSPPAPSESTPGPAPSRAVPSARAAQSVPPVLIELIQSERPANLTASTLVPRSEPTESVVVPPSAAAPGLAPLAGRKPRGMFGVAVSLLCLAAIGSAAIWLVSNTRLAPHLSAEPSLRGASALTATSSALRAPQVEMVLRLCGSNTVGAELAPALVEALLVNHGASDVARLHDRSPESTTIAGTLSAKRVGVEIRAHGSATAFTGLADGSCDIGMASRPIDDTEADILLERGLGDLRAAGAEHVIALDGVAVLVHPNNPLSALDRATLRDIFTGKLSDWSALHAPAGPIKVLARDSKSGTFDTFQHLILGKEALVEGAQRFEQSLALSDAVASDPRAIGFVGLAYVRAAKALAVGEPGAAPLLPTHFTVATEGYLLSRRLYLYTLPAPRTPWVTEFVNQALSPRGQEVVAKTQFIDLRPIAQDVPCDAHCPKSYAETLSGAQRISVDFRFQSGSHQPDNRARRDIDRLVSFLREFRSAKVLLLGFSDAIGADHANIKLSLERAQAIADELSMRGVHATAIKGFGSIMPVAPNDSEFGRQRNRRVEVWFQH